jgi:hypothetical protein
MPSGCGLDSHPKVVGQNLDECHVVSIDQGREIVPLSQGPGGVRLATTRPAYDGAMRLRRRANPPPELPGVPEGWSQTYVDPETPKPPEGWPAPRRPGAHVRIVPNESLLPGPLGEKLGEFVQTAITEGADLGVSVEVDTSDRTRPGEQRGGAQGIEAIDLLIYGAGAYAFRQAERLGDLLFDKAVEWVLRHRQKDGPLDDPVSVKLYGPDGNVIKKVLVPQGQGDAPPYDPEQEPEQ